MASVQNVRGTNNTVVNTGGISQILGGLINARVKAMLDTYTISASDLAVGSTITLGGTLPKGANILAIVLYVSAAQTSATFDVGDAGSSTRYASAHTGLQTANTPVIIGGKNYVITGTSDQNIVLTTAGATLAAASLYAFVLFTTD